MAELTAKTRFDPPLYDPRSSSPTSPRRYKRIFSGSQESSSDIAPSTVLRAFTDGTLPTPGTEEYKYLECTRSISPSERELGTRIAKTAVYAADWCLEINSWQWPGTFAPPTQESEVYTGERRINSGRESAAALGYCGSLPATLVQKYCRRLEQIESTMEKLDIPELKQYIRNIYDPSRSRPASALSRARVQQMEDLPLLLTQVMVQTLPLLAKLEQAMDVWSIRLAILHEVPDFLQTLQEGQRAIQLAWDAIRLPDVNETTAEDANSWIEAVNTITVLLKRKVSDLAGRVDGMLDTLEGREDVLPDSWIDEFEVLESEYGRWVVEAQKCRMQLELQLGKHLALEQIDDNATHTNHQSSNSPEAVRQPGKSAHEIRKEISAPMTQTDIATNIYKQPGKAQGRSDEDERKDPRMTSQTIADEPSKSSSGVDGTEAKPTLLKRASVASIESFHRSHVREYTTF
jgi:hypothetical protein